MSIHCPSPNCNSFRICKNGSYFRPSDGQKVQRWKFSDCSKQFSAATFQKAYKQNKRKVNHILFKLLASGISMRRAAKILNVHRTTVKRKLLYLSENSKNNQREILSSSPKANRIQFDDLITIEHTKCKPLAVSLAVEDGSRKILGFEVSVIPASGHLAKISRKKYGHRPNQRPRHWGSYFSKLRIM